MNYRIYSWRKPVKRIQLLPVDLSSRYPDSLRPSFLLVWCWKILLTAETTSLALATWWRRQIQMGQQIIHDRPLRLALRARTRQYGEMLEGWLSRAFTTLWHALVTLKRAGLPMSRNRSFAIPSQLRSPRMAARQSSWNPAASRFMAHSTDRRSPHVSSPRQQDLRQHLTEGHARLVEELLADEEELTRVSARVVRLQSLIRAQEHLLAVIASIDENQSESGQFPAEIVDNLVGIGKASSRGEVRNMRLFGGTRRIPRSRAPRNRS